MDHWKEPLDLEIDDTIIWRGEGLRIRNDTEGMILISRGMKGKVIMRSENLLADAARQAGLPITLRGRGFWCSLRMGSGWWWTAGRGLRGSGTSSWQDHYSISWPTVWRDSVPRSRHGDVGWFIRLGSGLGRQLGLHDLSRKGRLTCSDQGASAPWTPKRVKEKRAKS